MQPNLTGVPETMLWTLHNRASEASRPDGVIRDPECVKIYESLDYDFEASFGPAEASHGVRSQVFDREVRAFYEEFGGGTIVNLGEGLETQRYRLADLDLNWVSVDVSDAIDIREQFIEPDDRHKHVRCSILDPEWIDEVASGPVFLTAQGLLMYLPEDTIEPLLANLARRFPGGWFAFDTIPPWLSRKTTTSGWKLTKDYTAPPMPFGITRGDLPALVRRVVPGAMIREARWHMPRGLRNKIFMMFTKFPIIGAHAPAMWIVEFPD